MTTTSRGTRRKNPVLDMILIAMGAALITVCTWISIPATVSFTLQTFAITLLLGLLGGKRGTISILIYILLGLVGVPVFSKFQSGPAVLLGTTGGYIIGFIFMGLIYWLIVKLLGEKLWVMILASVIGLFVLYVFGTIWFIVVYLRNSGAVALQIVLGWCVYPFILPDLVKMVVALILAKQIKPHVPI